MNAFSEVPEMPATLPLVTAYVALPREVASCGTCAESGPSTRDCGGGLCRFNVTLFLFRQWTNFFNPVQIIDSIEGFVLLLQCWVEINRPNTPILDTTKKCSPAYAQAFQCLFHGQFCIFIFIHNLNLLLDYYRYKRYNRSNDIEPIEPTIHFGYIVSIAILKIKARR
jgi:hypothetical protein